jgi:hypothetical protein
MKDEYTKRLVAISMLLILFGGLLLALIFYAPEHPNTTQQTAMNTLMVFCGAFGVELIRGLKKILSSRGGPKKRQTR